MVTRSHLLLFCSCHSVTSIVSAAIFVQHSNRYSLGCNKKCVCTIRAAVSVIDNAWCIVDHTWLAHLLHSHPCLHLLLHLPGVSTRISTSLWQQKSPCNTVWMMDSYQLTDRIWFIIDVVPPSHTFHANYLFLSQGFIHGVQHCLWLPVVGYIHMELWLYGYVCTALEGATENTAGLPHHHQCPPGARLHQVPAGVDALAYTRYHCAMGWVARRHAVISQILLTVHSEHRSVYDLYTLYYCIWLPATVEPDLIATVYRAGKITTKNDRYRWDSLQKLYPLYLI